MAFTGAEPIRAETLDRFATAFASCGFRREAFYPCYGLAESTLMVTGAKKLQPPTVLSINKSEFEHGRARETKPNDPAAHRIVGCGRTLADQEVVIVRSESQQRCDDGEIGEIWTAGPSVAAGYWQQPTATESTFHAHLADGSGPYLRTGDLGFLHDGELFVAGRLKDLMVIRGRNHYPQDIEATIESAHAAIRTGCIAAFSSDIGGEERLVVIAEVDREFRRGDPVPVLAAIREAVAAEHGLIPHAAVLLKTGTIPMTSSGKVQRFACRDAFRAGTLDEVGRWMDDAPPATPQADADVPPTVDRASVESFIVEQIAIALGCAPADIDVTRPLTALGLDSLTATELKVRIETRFGKSLALSTILEDGASIHSLVENLLGVSGGHRPTRLDHQDESEWPLSINQRAMAFLQHLEPNSPVYVIAFAARVAGSLDVDASEHSFQRLIERHPALRTGLRSDGPTPTQNPQAHSTVDFAVIDAADWQPEELRSRLHDKAHRAFDLAHEPLMRVRLYRDASGGHTLLLAIHHIVSDHRTLQLLLEDAASTSIAPSAMARRPLFPN